MHILKHLPKQDGCRMPAEFAPHLGCIMIWPERTDSWRNGGYAARAAFTKIATAIAASEQVTMLASNMKPQERCCRQKFDWSNVLLMMLGQEMLPRLLFCVRMALAVGLTGALMLGAVW